MSESTTETVPVVLAEDQLLQLASAVATSLTAYFEAREEESTVMAAEPVEVTVTESVAVEPPVPDEEESGEVAASPPDVAHGQSAADESDAESESDTDTSTDDASDTEATGTEAA